MANAFRVPLSVLFEPLPQGAEDLKPTDRERTQEIRDRFQCSCSHLDEKRATRRIVPTLAPSPFEEVATKRSRPGLKAESG